MKKIIALLVLFALVLTLAACGVRDTSGTEQKKNADGTATEEAPADDSPLKEASGTYEGLYQKLVGDESKIEDEEFSVELKADGTGTSTRDGDTYKMTWTLDGEKFTMKETFAGMSIDYTGTLVDGVLDIFNGDPNDPFTYNYVYKKQ